MIRESDGLDIVTKQIYIYNERASIFESVSEEGGEEGFNVIINTDAPLKNNPKSTIDDHAMRYYDSTSSYAHRTPNPQTFSLNVKGLRPYILTTVNSIKQGENVLLIKISSLR